MHTFQSRLVSSSFLFVGIVLAFLSNPCFSQPTVNTADKIIGIVDNKIVLQSDLDLQLAQMAAQGNAVPEDGACLLFQQMLLQKLMIAQANKDSLAVTPEDIESELDRRMNYFIQQIGSKEKLEEYYHKPIVKLKEEFREPITDQLYAQRMQQKITGETKVSPLDVKKFFESIPKDSLMLINAEMEIGQIVIIPKVSNASKKEAKQDMLAIKERVKNGISFESQAKLYSEDPGSAVKGGDLGLVSRGEMVPEFEAALFKLKDGELSDIVETQYGYHLIKMISRQGDKAKVKHILVSPKINESDLTYALNRLDTLHRRLKQDSIPFNIAVDRYSNDEPTKLNGGMFINSTNGSTLIETAAIDPDVFFYADTLKVGNYSLPHKCKTREGKNAVRILYVKTKTPPHIINTLQDYAKLLELTTQQKQQDKMKQWVLKTIAKNYILIDDQYKSCESIKEFIK
jgi:peptidyl-prolyl cis-trans isomerase SurA